MKRILFLLAALPLVFSSCDKDDNGAEPAPQPGTGGDIEFAIGFAPQTRVCTGADFRSVWEDGDQIGLFAVALGTSLSATASDNYINNVKLTYNSAGGGSWSGPAYWPANSSSITALDFYAYYPYNASATDPTSITFNVQTDQSGATDGKSHYSLSDLLIAKSDNSGTGWAKGQTVNLTFSHALAMVQMTMTADRQNNIGAVGDISVSLRGIKTASTLNLGGQAVTATGDAGKVKMYRAGETDAGEPIFRALVPAQTVQGNYNFILNQFNELYNAGGAATLQAGQAEKHGVEMPYIPVVEIKKGTFLMGSSNGTNIGNGNSSDLNTTPSEPNRQSNETQHKVTLRDDFYMSKYPITFAQYDAFCNATNRQKPNDQGWGRGNRPVINVSWHDATEYCQWLSNQTGQTWTLPTEAQWEYACRGGRENQPFGIGTGYKLDNTLANFYWPQSWEWDGTSPSANISATGSNYPGSTQEVGSYVANSWGLYDMHGNVFEWCLDQCAWPIPDYGSGAVTDPVGTTGSDRVLRGGYWRISAQDCRSACRSCNFPGGAGGNIGFRVVFVP